MSNLEQVTKTSGFNVSSKYVVVNTAEIVQQFAMSGFTVQDIRMARVRSASKAGYQKHLITFSHEALKLPNIGDSVPRILLKNSYDGSSAFELLFGVYRLVCSNGLVVGNNIDAIKVRHVGPRALQQAIEAAEKIAQKSVLVAESVHRMQQKQLSHVDQLQFAVQAAELIKPATVLQFDSAQLLTPRRDADTGNDTWTVFNRIQENVIRGGLRYTTIDAQNRIRNATRRAVKAIDTNINLNKQLWQIAEKFAA